ncbi:NAD(+) diphosphatase [Mangrovicella endophytica]|uniref:NAD(+) diphosphatase n=1 Tax=Mangrovicella endophytica TaxID=2066697 RepID=UPI0018E4C49C|nr:NAD(+) diphosphatase [Mangrovicella endophytica]
MSGIQNGRAAQPAEMSARTGFAGNRLFRDSEHRGAATLTTALEHPDAVVYLTADRNWLAPGDREGFAFSVSAAERLGAEFGEAVLLGTDPMGRPVLAARLPAMPPADGGIAAYELRGIAEGMLVDADTEGRLAQATHLLGWHARNRFCGCCGGATVSEAAGLRRRCTACGEVIFPRIEPVTIMLVHDGAGRCILGRQPRFKPGFWSCLAGFVEAGETIEDAVRRETLEEAGIKVGAVSYLASQPWPFPGSLMIGCTALAAGTEILFDATELEDCRWFARAEVRQMFEGRHPDGLMLPGRFAIAHHLIKAFADGEV